MKESVEEKLKERIIEIFENYEDDSANFGWQELRKKYPEKRKTRPVFWWSSAAAILVFCGLGYMLTVTQQPDQLTAQKTKPTIETQKGTENSIDAPGMRTEENRSLSENKLAVAEKPAKEKNAAPSSSTLEALKMESVAASMLNGQPEATSPIGITLSTDSNYRFETLNPVLAAAVRQDQWVKNDIEIGSAVSKADLSGLTGFKNILPDEPKPEKEAATKEKLALTFYAGTFINYAEGSDNTINIGAGVSTGIALGKNFTLSTGLAIARNTLAFDDKLPLASSSSFRTDKQTLSSPAGSPKFAMIPSISRMDAELLNLDIPVAIRYDFNPATRKFFISGGLTSSSYLSETYTYSYNNFNLASNAFGASQDEKVDMSFARFDFAKTLNLSVGMTYDLGKKQNLTLEPFLKYPLGGLGSQNIIFGAAGINLKIQMKHSNKK